MKFLVSIVLIGIFFLVGCLPHHPPMDNYTVDDLKDDSIKRAGLADTSVKIVRYGKIEKYAFKPDSCFDSLTLGSKTSFAIFRKANGGFFLNKNLQRTSLAYYNLEGTEEMEVFVTGNEKDGYTPYKMIVQKARQKRSPVFPEKHEASNKINFISGHGIYIGMSPAYVMDVYTDQALTQWRNADTLCLKYTPEEKDKKYYWNYNYQSYSATYKFVNDLLRRMEYEVKPQEFEKVTE